MPTIDADATITIIPSSCFSALEDTLATINQSALSAHIKH